MLQTIHDKIKGWLAYVLLGAIAVVFVLWGINFTLGAPNYAAKVDGREIPSVQLREAYQRQLAQIERSSPAPLDEAQRSQIKRRVLEDFVVVEALLGHVQDLGYAVSHDDLMKAMAQIPAFQVDGKFDAAHAVAVLKSQGRSIPEVEDMIRRQVQIGQLESALRASSFATGAEMKQLESLTRQQRELSWFVLPAAKFASEVHIDDAAIKAYYDAHKGEYMTPETVDLRYVEISLADTMGKVSVDPSQLKAYFEEQKAKNPESYTQPEQRRVSHILITVTDPKEADAAKAKAEALLTRIRGGEDFGKLAKEFSQDPASAQQGGDLGWSERKVWVAPFADAAFAMGVDEVRGPVKTQFGYHIIKLVGIRPAAAKTFEESKPDLEVQYRRDQAERLFNAAQDKLADAALQNATDLDAVARKAGLPVKEAPGFSRAAGGGALGSAPKAVEAAFSPEVLEGRLSPIVALDAGRGVVMRASNHRLPQQKPLETVKTEIIEALKKARSFELAAAAAQDAVKRLTAGEAMAEVAKADAAALQPARFVGRPDQTVPAEIRMAAFEAAKPDGKPRFQAVKMNNGDSAVLALTAVRLDPGPDTQLAQLRRQYADQLAGAEAQDYASAARAAAKVTLNPQAIE